MNKINLQINFSPDTKKKGIWRFSKYLGNIEEKYQLTLDEGTTGDQLFEDIILKREDENPTGSLKDRGMAFLISKAFSFGQKNMAISSSGNAAISAGEYCKLAKLNLKVFVSEKTEAGKIEILKKSGVEIIFSRKPISDCTKFCLKNNYYNLRPSQNSFGPEGYKTIAFELAAKFGLIEDIFIPVSSGVALVGIARGFKQVGFLPRIHLCQSSSAFYLAKKFDNNFVSESTSLAKSLVAKTSSYEEEILKLVRESKGFGWVIGNQEISLSQKKFEDNNLITSAEGALAFAAINKAKKNKFKIGKIVCLLTGKKY